MRPTGSRSAGPLAANWLSPGIPTGQPRVQVSLLPARLDVLLRARGLLAEEGDEVVGHGLAALALRELREAARLVTADEAEDGADLLASGGESSNVAAIGPSS